MFLFRSLTIGLLGACVLLLVRAPHAVPATPHAPIATLALQPRTAPASASIVDVAGGLRGAEVASLLQLSPGDHVVAVDDHPVTTDLEAGAAISSRAPGGRGFLDLEVVNADGERRRVLVLMH